MPIHEIDENGGAIFSDTDYLKIDEIERSEPRANRILKQVRNNLGMGGGIITGIILAAGPTENDPKIITVIGGLAMISAAIGATAGAVLYAKECWDYRSTEKLSTHEGDNL